MEYPLTWKEYDKALRKNKLLGLKCKSCGAVTCPPKMTCDNCTGTDLEVTELTGKGKLVTYTVMQIAPEGRENETPYIMALVELDEGPWIFGRIGGVDPGKMTIESIGKKLRLSHSVFYGDKFSESAAGPLFYFE